MTIEEEISAFLTSHDITVYPDYDDPDCEYPYVVYSEADRATVMTFSGPVDLDSWRMVMECRGGTKSESRTLANQIRALLLGYMGLAGALRICGVFSDNESSEMSAPVDGSAKGVWTTTLELTIWYKG